MISCITRLNRLGNLCALIVLIVSLIVVVASIKSNVESIAINEPSSQRAAKLLGPALIQTTWSRTSEISSSQHSSLIDDNFVKQFFAEGHVKIYRPTLFESIGKATHFDHNDLIAAIDHDNLVCISSDSKSGQAFWKSADGRIVLKTIKHYECKNLLQVADGLEEHFRSGLSCIAPVLGLYRVKLTNGTKKYFMVCSNVYPKKTKTTPRRFSISSNPTPVLSKFDLKGSTVGRLAKQYSEVKKDLDLMYAGRKLNLGQARSTFINVLNRDVAFLSKHRFMDYSLLVATDYKDMNDIRTFLHRMKVQTGVSLVLWNRGRFECSGGDGLVYHFGIIDFLQKYTFRKMLETFLKGFFSNARKISCVSPTFYAQRFVRFLAEWSE